MKTYIASPFFNDTQLNQVKEIENLLINLKDEFYSPRQHGNFSELKLDKKMSDLAKSIIFQDNIYQIKSSQRVIVNINGHRDIGTLFEFGIALALHKCINVYIEDNYSGVDQEFPKLCLNGSKLSDIYIKVVSNADILSSVHKLLNFKVTENSDIIVDTNDKNSYPLGIMMLGYFYSKGNKVSYISNYISKSNLMISESGIKQYKSKEDYDNGVFIDYDNMIIN